MQEIIKVLDDKNISVDRLNKLNNEYEQKIQKIIKELNDKNISLNEYKKESDALRDIYNQEKEKLEKELKESKEYIKSDKKR